VCGSGTRRWASAACGGWVALNVGDRRFFFQNPNPRSFLLLD
jgi:hypothetical protein